VSGGLNSGSVLKRVQVLAIRTSDERDLSIDESDCDGAFLESHLYYWKVRELEEGCLSGEEWLAFS
jgi:hypothetical protein